MKEELYKNLIESLHEGGIILRNELPASRRFVFEPLQVKRIRDSYGLTQEKFAALLGISVGTLRNWEQGRRKPEGTALILLKVAEKHPEAILDVVQQIE
jgi:putative transcriptional regulator